MKEELLQKIEEKYTKELSDKIIKYADSEFGEKERLKLKYLQSVLDTEFMEYEHKLLTDEQVKIISDKLEISTDEEIENILIDIIDNVAYLKPLKMIFIKYKDIISKIKEDGVKNINLRLEPNLFWINNNK